MSVSRRDEDLEDEGRARSWWGVRVPKEGTPPTSNCGEGRDPGGSQKGRDLGGE